ncbi:hypothetical protein BDQ17DRAFT_1415496 [Cyathus striatus]|nr:hypothetical protein BDQ17DRAFT_1415496 [Cyathus striatus]
MAHPLKTRVYRGYRSLVAYNLGFNAIQYYNTKDSRRAAGHRLCERRAIHIDSDCSPSAFVLGISKMFKVRDTGIVVALTADTIRTNDVDYSSGERGEDVRRVAEDTFEGAVVQSDEMMYGLSSPSVLALRIYNIFEVCDTPTCLLFDSTLVFVVRAGVLTPYLLDYPSSIL